MSTPLRRPRDTRVETPACVVLLSGTHRLEILEAHDSTARPHRSSPVSIKP